MFNAKSYASVNREERHFGFLFASAMIYDLDFRREICTRISKLIGTSIDSTKFEIYTEVAALRDFWFDLGDSKVYSSETHEKRRKIIEKILVEKKYPPEIIDNGPVFWTRGRIGNGKLWCPSEWDIKELIPLEKSKNDLVEVRWCFNAKPDILIVSSNISIFLELKVESGAGTNEHGYDQIDIQKKIAHYMNSLIPAFTESQFFNLALTVDGKIGLDGFTWNDVLDILKRTSSNHDGSKLVYDSLKHLERYIKIDSSLLQKQASEQLIRLFGIRVDDKTPMVNLLKYSLIDENGDWDLPNGSKVDFTYDMAQKMTSFVFSHSDYLENKLLDIWLNENQTPIPDTVTEIRERFTDVIFLLLSDY